MPFANWDRFPRFRTTAEPRVFSSSQQPFCPALPQNESSFRANCSIAANFLGKQKALGSFFNFSEGKKTIFLIIFWM